jgi:hypothetical protein
MKYNFTGKRFPDRIKEMNEEPSSITTRKARKGKEKDPFRIRGRSKAEVFAGCEDQALAEETAKQRILKGVIIDPSTGCWNWIGRKWLGYGQMSFLGKERQVHRLSYFVFKGDFPQNLVLDHKCDNKACCNPEHLRPVSNRENTLRGRGPAAVNHRKSKCNQGHDYNPENTYYRPGSGHRRCRICVTVGNREDYKKRKAMRFSLPVAENEGRVGA